MDGMVVVVNNALMNLIVGGLLHQKANSILCTTGLRVMHLMGYMEAVGSVIQVSIPMIIFVHAS